MNIRKRMILKSAESCYCHGKITKLTKRMWLTISVDRFAKDFKEWVDCYLWGGAE